MAEIAGKDTGVQTGAPYDDMFRTLLNDCRQLVIPLVNKVFSENYTGREDVVFSPNEYYPNRQGGEEDKRITDSSFSITGKVTKNISWNARRTRTAACLCESSSIPPRSPWMRVSRPWT